MPDFSQAGPDRPANCRVLFATDTVRIGMWQCASDAPRSAGGIEHLTAHEVVLPRRGLFIREQGRRRVVADPNTTLFANAGDEFRFAHPAGGGDRTTFLMLAPSALEDLARIAEPLDSRLEFPFEQLPAAPAADLLHYELVRLLRQSGAAGDSHAVEEAALTLLRATLAPERARTRNRRLRVHARQARAVADAQEFLAVHHAQPLRLADVGRAVHYSPWHIARVFRAHTGRSVHQHVTLLRLRAVLDALLSGHGTLARIALDAGFASHSHMTDAFRRTWGLPPSALRHRPTLRRLRVFTEQLHAQTTRS